MLLWSKAYTVFADSDIMSHNISSFARLADMNTWLQYSHTDDTPVQRDYVRVVESLPLIESMPLWSRQPRTAREVATRSRCRVRCIDPLCCHQLKKLGVAIPSDKAVLRMRTVHTRNQHCARRPSFQLIARTRRGWPDTQRRLLKLNVAIV